MDLKDAMNWCRRLEQDGFGPVARERSEDGTTWLIRVGVRRFKYPGDVHRYMRYNTSAEYVYLTFGELDVGAQFCPQLHPETAGQFDRDPWVKRSARRASVTGRPDYRYPMPVSTLVRVHRSQLPAG